MKAPTSGIASIDLSHHAYAIVGGASAHEALIIHLAKKHKARAAGDPDFSDRRYETFAIDDARELKALAETRPTREGGRRIFVLAMNGITVEAQNALLKLLEEPNESSHFFLVVPSARTLIPTVRSRMQIILAAGGDATVSEADAALVEDAKGFLKAPLAKRLDIVKKLMDEVSKEKRPKQDAIDLLGAIERELHVAASTGKTAGIQKAAAGLEAVLLAEEYASDRAPSLKMLLEYVALSA